MSNAVLQDKAQGDPFDTGKVFKSQDRLMDYVEHLFLAGHSKGRIETYYRTMIAAFSPHRHTAPTPARAE